MDDFLHNLRSGKLKQADRQNRSYGDQNKGGQRRNPMDRRKRDGENREVCERLQAIKDILENLAGTQKRLADAFIERNRTEARRTKAMEMMTESIYRLLFPDAENGGLLTAAAAAADPSREASRPAPPESQPEAFVTPSDENSLAPAAAENEPVPAAATSSTAADREETGKADQAERQPGDGGLTEADRNTLFVVIQQMRSEGNNWERIARHIAAQGYPTLSGKGVWRGISAKNLYNKMATPA